MKLCEIFNSKYYERKWKKKRKDVSEKHSNVTWQVAQPVGIATGHAPAAAPHNG